MLPTFIIIGAPKCATTWLYENLKKHPQIFMAYPKEIHFFDDDKKFQKGLTFYKKHFDAVKKEKAVGEATPNYLGCKKTAKRIFHAMPTIKLIAIFRDPSDRLYSDFKMELRTSGKPFKPLSRQNLKEMPYLLSNGFYYHSISHYLQFFPPSQFLFLFYDDIIKNPILELKRVCAFLGVDTSFPFSGAHKKVFSGNFYPAFPFFYALCFKLCTIIKFNCGFIGVVLFNCLKKTGVYPFLKKIMPATEVPPLNKRMRKNLIAIYHGDILKLEKLTGRDLSSWLK